MFEPFDKPLASRWDELKSERYDFLDTARQAAEVTVPYLQPPEGHSSGDTLTRPYQSLGARGVNNLSSKLLLALFPPQGPFFRLEIVDELAKAITQKAEQATGQGAQAQQEIAAGLSKIEKGLMDRLDTNRHRVQLYEAFRNLIVSGNTVIKSNDDGTLKCFRLDSFVVKRDAEGNLLELIVHEQISPRTLDEELQAGISDMDQPVDLYTGIRRDSSDSFSLYQELEENMVPGSDGTYPRDRLPWLVLRWSAISGEDYGRGIVEDYLGDLQSLNGFCKHLLEGAAAAARVIFLVDPNSSTSPKKLAEAPNLSYVKGRAEDVMAQRVDKGHDFQTAQAEKVELEKRLKQAFLLNTAVQRDAERVTAEEIRFIAGELEDTLGGTYAILSEELQTRLLNLLMQAMRAEGALKLPDKAMRVKIVTGLEGLSRNHEAQKLLTFVQTAGGVLPSVGSFINPSAFLQRLAVAQGIESEGLIKTQKQLQAEQQQAQAASMVQEATPGVAQEAAKQAANQGGAQ